MSETLDIEERFPNLQAADDRLVAQAARAALGETVAGVKRRFYCGSPKRIVCEDLWHPSRVAKEARLFERVALALNKFVGRELLLPTPHAAMPSFVKLPSSATRPSQWRVITRDERDMYGRYGDLLQGYADAIGNQYEELALAYHGENVAFLKQRHPDQPGGRGHAFMATAHDTQAYLELAAATVTPALPMLHV